MALATTARAPGGGRWHAASVGRALEFGPSESQLLLRRLGRALAEIQERGEVNLDGLQEIGRESLVHWRRLVEPTSSGNDSDYAPAVDLRRQRAQLAPGGWKVLGFAEGDLPRVCADDARELSPDSHIYLGEGNRGDWI